MPPFPLRALARLLNTSPEELLYVCYEHPEVVEGILTPEAVEQIKAGSERPGQSPVFA